MTAGILVLEGADGGGKTTLANYLRAHHGARYVHLGLYLDIWKWHVAAYFRAQAWAAAGHLVVVDRHWLSECVYGEIYRGGATYPVAARCLDRLWLRSAALTVVCAQRDQAAQVARHERLKSQRHEQFSNIRDVVAYYADLVEGRTSPERPGTSYLAGYQRQGTFGQRPDVVRYDLAVDGAEDSLPFFVELLLARLTAHRASQLPTALQPNQPNLGGHLALAKTCLVGEAPSPAARRGCGFPFVDRERHLSAATWLNRALHELGVVEPDLLLVNAQGLGELEEVVARRPDLRYVALGTVAAKRLEQLGVEPWKVDHPQWARRFAHRESYAEQLEEVLP